MIKLDIQRVIKKWSEKLTKEYGNGYSEKNLKRMRKFYIYFKNENERNYYINKCILNNLSVRGLINEIKTKSFDRLSYENKKHIKLITDKETSLDIKDMSRDPILINIDQTEKMSESVLKKSVLKELEHFFLEYVSDLSLKLTTYKLENNFKKATA